MSAPSLFLLDEAEPVPDIPTLYDGEKVRSVYTGFIGEVRELRREPITSRTQYLVFCFETKMLCWYGAGHWVSEE